MVSEVKTDAQREMIVAVAREKFRRYGIRRVTVAEIAADLRISKKTVYRHFDSKEAIVRACVEQILSRAGSQLAPILDDEATLGARIGHSWQVLAQLPGLVSPELVADIKADYPHLWSEIDEARHLLVTHVEGLVRRGIETGDVRPEIHPKVLLRALFAVIENVMVPEVLTQGEFAPVEALNTLFTLLAHGMFEEGRAPSLTEG